jgi:dihydrofolate reductase
MSLRRPLPGRTNIVVTRDADFRSPGAVATTSFAAARAVATGDALRRLATEIAVIGGAEIYAQWMDIADRLEITEVHARPEGDTYFAAIDPADWEEVARAGNSAVRTTARLFLRDISPESRINPVRRCLLDNYGFRLSSFEL